MCRQNMQQIYKRTTMSKWILVSMNSLTTYLPRDLKKNINLMRYLVNQKQPCRGVLRKMRSENMQQIYRRTSMLKCDFNKAASQLYWNRTSAWVISVNLVHIFKTPLYKNTSRGLLLVNLATLNLLEYYYLWLNKVCSCMFLLMSFIVFSSSWSIEKIHNDIWILLHHSVITNRKTMTWITFSVCLFDLQDIITIAYNKPMLSSILGQCCYFENLFAKESAQ